MVPAELAAVAAPFLPLILVTSLSFAFDKEPRLAFFLILHIVVPSLCLFIGAQVRPPFRERYLNVIAPAYYLDFSYGLIALPGELPRWKIATQLSRGFVAPSGTHCLPNRYCASLYQ